MLSMRLFSVSIRSFLGSEVRSSFSSSFLLGLLRSSGSSSFLLGLLSSSSGGSFLLGLLSSGGGSFLLGLLSSGGGSFLLGSFQRRLERSLCLCHGSINLGLGNGLGFSLSGGSFSLRADDLLDLSEHRSGQVG